MAFTFVMVHSFALQFSRSFCFNAVVMYCKTGMKTKGAFEAAHSGVLTVLLIDIGKKFSSGEGKYLVMHVLALHKERGRKGRFSSGEFGLTIQCGCMWLVQTIQFLQMWQLSMKNPLGSNSQAVCLSRGFSAWYGGLVHGHSSPSGT